MSMFHTFWTVALFAIFVAIVFWAFNSKRKSDFEDASRLPLENNGHDEMIDGDNRNG